MPVVPDDRARGGRLKPMAGAPAHRSDDPDGVVRPSAEDCRRTHRRRTLPDDGTNFLEFTWPRRGGHACRMPINDISPAGMSFILQHDLPGLEVCGQIRRVTAHVGERSFRADMVVIHITSNPGRPTICGTLLYPLTDDDLGVLRELLAEADGDHDGS